MGLRRAALKGRAIAKREARKGMRKKASNEEGLNSKPDIPCTSRQRRPILGRMMPENPHAANLIRPICMPIPRNTAYQDKPILGRAVPKSRTTRPPSIIQRLDSKSSLSSRPARLIARDLQWRRQRRNSTEQPEAGNFLKARDRRSKADSHATIHELRQLLGLSTAWSSNRFPDPPEDALIVSVDTETEKQGLLTHVVELGVSVLDTRDIAHEPPGTHAQNWIAKIKTKHWVVNVARRRLQGRMLSGLFASSVLASPATVKSQFLAATQQSNQNVAGARNVILIGHSVVNDVQNLYRSPGLALDLEPKPDRTVGVRFGKVFDTQDLALDAIDHGAKMISLRLGMLVNWLGLDGRYADGKNVVGTHNAGNDAAYTMMALLLLAVRWNEIIGPRFEPGPRGITRYPAASIAASRPPQQLDGNGSRHSQYRLWRLLSSAWHAVARRLSKK